MQGAFQHATGSRLSTERQLWTHIWITHTRTQSPESNKCYSSLTVVVLLVFYHNNRQKCLLQSCSKELSKYKEVTYFYGTATCLQHRYAVYGLYKSCLYKCFIYSELSQFSTLYSWGLPLSGFTSTGAFPFVLDNNFVCLCCRRQPFTIHLAHNHSLHQGNLKTEKPTRFHFLA